jgi:syntaxin 5
MGQLFSQMATLVMEQGETLARIEDDVEVGLSETKEAHASMEQFYEITKGNRGMIIKIFLLLVFFIFLFLVWT